MSTSHCSALSAVQGAGQVYASASVWTGCRALRAPVAGPRGLLKTLDYESLPFGMAVAQSLSVHFLPVKSQLRHASVCSAL